MRKWLVRFLTIGARYLLALAAIAATTLVLQLDKSQITSQLIGLVYLLPVILSAAFGGLGAGILASLAGFLCFNYFFIPPYNTLMVHRGQDLLALLIFLLIAGLISQLLGRANTAAMAATAREREATQLYELTTALSGIQKIDEILHTLGNQIVEILHLDLLKIEYQPKGSEKRTIFAFPTGVLEQPADGAVRVEMETAREKQGILVMWRETPFSQREERLLRTFASQGALAIEHTSLMEAGNRARMLEESDRLKSILLSSVSHELRTPLATIKAAVSSMRSENVKLDPASSQELLAAIEEETDHLNLLVGNLLDTTRMEMGGLRPQRKWNSLAEIVNGVLKRMRQVAHQHVIVVDIPDTLPPIPVDYSQIEQVFTNLVSNSVKYAPEKTEIRICAVPQTDRTLLVTLSNEGPQLESADLTRIFEKFYRVTAADRVAGAGLGLSICKGIIEAHGGRIWAENTPGHLLFKFTLPLD
jgi:two-component system sensor histidine kinase KdpD